MGSGANVSCTTIDKRNALHFAAQNRYDIVYERLLEAGVYPFVKDNQGATAEYYLSKHHTEESTDAQFLSWISSAIEDRRLNG